MHRCAKTKGGPTKMRAFASLLTLLVLVLGVGLPPAAEAREDKPGQFDYLTLAMSWSPTYCANAPEARNEPQCTGVRPYAFVLHGLWPQYEKGWPEFCRTKDRPWVPRDIVQGMLDIMPSPKLVIHQYRKHGTCSGLKAETYFKASRALFQKVKIPERFVQPQNQINISPKQVEAAFLEANPGLRPTHISIVCGRRQRLREVRICFTPRGRFRDCTANEDQRRLCRAGRVTMPPVRGPRRRSALPRATSPRL